MILKPITDITSFSKLAENEIGVFGSKEWLSVYGDALKLVGIYKDEHQLIGGFFYLTTKKYGFNFVKLPPYTPHCGLFFSNESKNKSSANSFAKEVVDEVCSYITGLNSALTVLAFPSYIVDLQPFIWSKYKVIPNYTYRIDLAQGMETIVSHFDPKNRNAINKALKETVIVKESGRSKKELFEYFSASLGSAKANVYGKELNHIFTRFSGPTNSFALEASKEGKSLGLVFCVYDKYNCYYLLGGVDKGSGVQGVNNLLVKESIQKAMSLGCKVFDFEGSMLKGVEKFFRSFGPELFPYYTINKAKLPIELALKFKKRELF